MDEQEIDFSQVFTREVFEGIRDTCLAYLRATNPDPGAKVKTRAGTMEFPKVDLTPDETDKQKKVYELLKVRIEEHSGEVAIRIINGNVTGEQLEEFEIDLKEDEEEPEIDE